MEESLSDLIKQRDEADESLKVLDAMDRITARHPGTTTLADVEQLTGRSWIDLVVEETGLTAEQVEAAAGRIMSSDDSEAATSTEPPAG